MELESNEIVDFSPKDIKDIKLRLKKIKNSVTNLKKVNLLLLNY
jgi:hypothetical protein